MVSVCSRIQNLVCVRSGALVTWALVAFRDGRSDGGCWSCPAGRLEKVQCGLRREVDRLRDAAREMAQDRTQTGVRSLADYAHQLGGHCNVTLVNDALRDLHGALEDPSTTFSSLTELNAVSECVYPTTSYCGDGGSGTRMADAHSYCYELLV